MTPEAPAGTGVFQSSTLDDAYHDRNLLALLVVRLLEMMGDDAGGCGIRETEDPDWPAVYFDLYDATGKEVQVSYHVPRALVKDLKLPAYTKPWDGHDLAEKRRRIMAFVRGAP